MVFIKEITLKHRLGRGILQVDLIFFYCIGILPLLVVHVILVEVIVVLAW